MTSLLTGHRYHRGGVHYYQTLGAGMLIAAPLSLTVMSPCDNSPVFVWTIGAPTILQAETSP